MGHRFTDGVWIQQRMNAKDARVQQEATPVPKPPTLADEITRRVERGDWAVIGLASCGTLPVQLLAWCYEEFGVAAHDLVLAVIVDKRDGQPD